MFEGKDKRFGGDEVGGDDQYLALCQVECGVVGCECSAGFVTGGTAILKASDDVAGFDWWWEELGCEELLDRGVGHIEPVAQKGVLQLLNQWAPDLEVEVDGAWLVVLGQIDVVEVDTSYKGGLGVDNHYFAVVTQ